MSESTWLPNLVGGTSIWKLAVDLNEAKYFDGRLLVPETEGSESLPVTVRWDLTGLVPLKEAREKYPDDCRAAMSDFQSALDRVAKVFSTPNTGFDKYKEAFTVPSPEADGGANYFYSPSQKKLFVINWGASPRSMGGRADYVFGYEDWGKHWSAARVPIAAIAAAATGAAVIAAAAAANPNEPAEPQKEEKKKRDDKARPWWIWPLFGLIAITIVLLALFLLKACDDQKLASGADASDAPVEGASADGAAAKTDADGSAASDTADDRRDAGADANAPSGADAAADASSDGKDGGKDAGKDASAANGDDDDDDFPEGPSGGPGSSGGGPGSSGGGPGSSGTVVKIGPGGGQKTSVHRKHYTDDAVKWRIATGAQKVSRTEDQGHRFDVWLTPGQTFEGVRVEWQDKAGKWHVH